MAGVIPERRFPHGHFPVRRYLFIFIQYLFYVQFIWI